MGYGVSELGRTPSSLQEGLHIAGGCPLLIMVDFHFVLIVYFCLSSELLTEKLLCGTVF